MTYSVEECQRICELTHQYLHWMVFRVRNDHTEADNILEGYMKPVYALGDLSLPELYEHFLNHARNKSTGGNAINAIFGKSQDAQQWKQLKRILGNFDPQYVRATFPNVEALRTTVVEAYGQSTFSGPVESYIISILEIGHFLAQYADGKALYDALDTQYTQNPTVLIRHLLGLKGVHKRALSGLGEGLMRDALKELGYVNYVKPDVHINDIAGLLHLVPSNASYEKVAEVVAEVALQGGVTPYLLDKFFFLIGSGAFFRPGQEQINTYYKKRDPITRKHEFANYVLERIALPPTQIGDRIALLVNYTDDGLLRGQVGEIQEKPTLSFITAAFANTQKRLVVKKLYPTEFVVLRGEA